MKKIIFFFLIILMMSAGLVFATDEDENRELGIEMKNAGKPTLQEAGAKAQGKLYKYNKAKKKVIGIFDPSANKEPVKQIKPRLETNG